MARQSHAAGLTFKKREAPQGRLRVDTAQRSKTELYIEIYYFYWYSKACYSSEEECMSDGI